MTRRDFLKFVTAFGAAAASLWRRRTPRPPAYAIYVRPDHVGVTTAAHARGGCSPVTGHHSRPVGHPDQYEYFATADEAVARLGSLGGRKVEPFGPAAHWQYHGFDDEFLNFCHSLRACDVPDFWAWRQA